MRLGGCMNWRKSFQKLTRLRVRVLEAAVAWVLIPLFVVLLTLEATLAATLAGLGFLVRVLEKTGPRLILPPGARLRNMLHVIYPPKIAERVFDQTIADMRLEWAEAMLHDQKWLAYWVRVRGLLTVLLTVLAHAVTALSSILKLVR